MAFRSTWSINSILNNNYQLETGEKLQKYPRVGDIEWITEISLLLKSYESGYQRKTANTSTKEQILQFLTGVPNENEFIGLLKKAVCTICYCGGLWCADLISLGVNDVEESEGTGFWIRYRYCSNFVINLHWLCN